MSTIKKLAGQTAIYGVSSILGRLLNYLLVPLHTKEGNFDPVEYGVISEFYAYVAFLVVFLMFGMETTFFRFVNESKDKEKTFNQSFSIVLVVSVVFLASILIFAQPVANLIGYPQYKTYVIWFAFILSFDAISSLFLAKLRFLEQPKRFATIQLTSIGVNIFFNVIFIVWFLPGNREFGIGYIFLANLLASLIKPIMLYREISQFRFIMDRVMAKAMIWFATPLLIASFAGIINETLDRILIKQMTFSKGADYAQSQVGIYSANYKLSIIITLFIQAFRYAAEPFFFAQEKNKDKSKVYSKVMTYFIIIVSAIFLVVTLYIDVFKWFIPNEAYWEGLKIVPILLLANVFLGIYYNQSIWYKLSNQTKFGAYIAIGGALITLTLNIILIPLIGYMGSAWTTFIVYFLMMIASYFLGQKYYPIKYNLRKGVTFLMSAIILFSIDKWMINFDNQVLSYGFKTILIIVYIGIIFFIENPLKELKKTD